MQANLLASEEDKLPEDELLGQMTHVVTLRSRVGDHVSHEPAEPLFLPAWTLLLAPWHTSSSCSLITRTFKQNCARRFLKHREMEKISLTISWSSSLTWKLSAGRHCDCKFVFVFEE